MDFDFNMESATDLNSRVVLSWVVFVPQATKLIKVSVTLNGQPVGTYNFNGRNYNAFHEVIQGNVLKAGSNNVEFNITRGAGELQISDIILHYRKNI